MDGCGVPSMSGLLDVSRRAKRVFNLDVTEDMFTRWRNQIQYGGATFIKRRGPYKQLWQVEWEGHTIQLVYKDYEIVRIHSVDDKKGNQPYVEEL